MPSLNYFDKDKQEWVAIPLGGGGDLSDYAKAEDLPAVFEQADQPVGKDGDLWLKPSTVAPTAPVIIGSVVPDKSSITMADVQAEIDSHVGDTAAVMELRSRLDYLTNDYLIDPSNAVATEFKQSILDAVKSMLNGGKTPPDDIGWTECPKVAGSGLVEARLVNGIIQLRGTVTITTTAWTTVRKLPANFPKPAADYATLTAGGESGVAERVCQVVIRANGDININSFGSKITSL